MLLVLGLAVGAAGLVSGRPLLGGLAAAVLVLAAFARWTRARRWREPETAITVDDTGVTVSPPPAAAQHVAWSELIEVTIATTTDGPIAGDVSFLLRAADGRGCVVPAPLATELLARVGRLPGFDRVLCWKGAAGDGLAAVKRRP